VAEAFHRALVVTVAAAADEPVTVGPGVVVFDEQGGVDLLGSRALDQGDRRGALSRAAHRVQGPLVGGSSGTGPAGGARPAAAVRSCPPPLRTKMPRTGIATARRYRAGHMVSMSLAPRLRGSAEDSRRPRLVERRARQPELAVGVRRVWSGTSCPVSSARRRSPVMPARSATCSTDRPAASRNRRTCSPVCGRLLWDLDRRCCALSSDRASSGARHPPAHVVPTLKAHASRYEIRGCRCVVWRASGAVTPSRRYEPPWV
jgi:hypothetical protein